MLVYEVNLEVKAAIFDEYIVWLKLHIKEILVINGFIKADLFIIKDEDKPGVKKITVDYYINNYDNYREYIKTHAPKLRADSLKKFDGQYSVQRRIMEIEKSFCA